ncbi:MAG: nuclear transport factor 2 family protein [Cyanobacteria bacterium P01_A01_bin.83]
MSNATINKEHPNISILKKLNTCNLAESADMFAEDFTWHCFNPKLSYIGGNHTGLKGFQEFLKKLETLTGGTLQIDPVSITTIGDGLVVTYVKDKMTLENRALEPDAVIIWRIANDKLNGQGVSPDRRKTTGDAEASSASLRIIEAGISHMYPHNSYRQPI